MGGFAVYEDGELGHQRVIPAMMNAALIARAATVQYIMDKTMECEYQ
jgi:hypothetical protein